MIFRKGHKERIEPSKCKYSVYKEKLMKKVSFQKTPVKVVFLEKISVSFIPPQACFLKFFLKSKFILITFFSKTESNLSKEMELVIKDIKNTTQKKYMDYGRNPGSPDNDFLFMYSVAR